jgi:uncharacterized protein YcnI
MSEATYIKVVNVTSKEGRNHSWSHTRVVKSTRPITVEEVTDTYTMSVPSEKDGRMITSTVTECVVLTPEQVAKLGVYIEDWDIDPSELEEWN